MQQPEMIKQMYGLTSSRSATLTIRLPIVSVSVSTLMRQIALLLRSLDYARVEPPDDRV